jgi:hypothetical protein
VTGVLWTQGVGFRKDKGGKDDWFIAALSDYRSGTVVATTGGLWGASGRSGGDVPWTEVRAGRAEGRAFNSILQ